MDAPDIIDEGRKVAHLEWSAGIKKFKNLSPSQRIVAIRKMRSIAKLMRENAANGGSKGYSAREYLVLAVALETDIEMRLQAYPEANVQ